jgi:hypothetical protein
MTHPNIVPLYTFGEAEGVMYFVMGYVRGESLSGRIRREGKVPPEDTRAILAELASALDYAHSQSVVHRDIKPDNVLIDDESGRPMLTDFGVAKAQASGQTLTAAGTALGTPYYMSPEQASGERMLDGRSDIYSLGVMGYQMLSGRLPFEGETFQEVAVQHMTKEASPLASVAPESPADLCAMVDRCLEKDPSHRWSDAGALRAAIAGPGATEDTVPRELRSADGITVRVALILLCVGYLAVGAVSWEGLRSSVGAMPVPALLAFLFVLVPLTVINGLLVARRGGFEWGRIWRVALQSPRWWPFWYPAKRRRPGDVWERLPIHLQRARIFLGATALVFLLMVDGGRRVSLCLIAYWHLTPRCHQVG